MKDSRELVLARIRETLKAAQEVAAISREYRLASERDQQATLDLFVERLTDYHATVVRATSATLPSVIAEALESRGVRRLAIPADLPQTWLSVIPQGEMELLREGDHGPEATGYLSKGRLASVHGILSGCALAVAETGTIILDSGPGQGRRVLTLLPDYHLCVVRSGQVMATVPEAVTRLGATVAEHRSPITLISGPSATSDIELERVEGVHGPRTLDVILVEGEP
jgi:L-lactate dehydrogenase complex protein LldG